MCQISLFFPHFERAQELTQVQALLGTDQPSCSVSSSSFFSSPSSSEDLFIYLFGSEKCALARVGEKAEGENIQADSC